MILLLPPPHFNILFLAVHYCNLCFLLNDIFVFTVISLSAMSRLVQQNLNQLCPYGSKTGPLFIDCCPRDTCPSVQAWQNPYCCCLYPEIPAGCGHSLCFSLQYLPLLSLGSFSLFILT